MAKDTGRQEAAMEAADTINQSLRDQLDGLNKEHVRQEGYRAGLLHASRLVVSCAASVDKLFEEKKIKKRLDLASVKN